jgi:predicted TIM-barrel fold metal-dependent hydrolase
VARRTQGPHLLTKAKLREIEGFAMTDGIGEGRIKRGVAPTHYWDPEWLLQADEDVIDPSQPIIDAHHHIWNHYQRYLIDELAEDLTGSGHNIRGTVYIECTSMYRKDGNAVFESIGEVEFANGVGAVFAAGTYGDVRACSGIVGRVDLTLGDLGAEVMKACVARAPERFRGIRHMAGWDESDEVHTLRRPPPKGLFLSEAFRKGFSHLAPLGLSFDAQNYFPQLPELIDLADAFPGTTIISNHLGGFVRIGPYATNTKEHFETWRSHLFELAKRPNVFIKIGGLGMRSFGFEFVDRDSPPNSEELARAWGPLVETCIEAFGPSRAIFESNFPVDKVSASYKALWNAYKRIVANYSPTEKADLFAGTAIRAYRLPKALGNISANAEGIR